MGGDVIVFVNPRSTSPGKQPLPLSVLSLASAIGHAADWHLVDGNRESDPVARVLALTEETPHAMVAVTVMAGPQLTHAIRMCQTLRARRPTLRVVWGGYFPTQHADTALASGIVDYVVRGQGERAFAELVSRLDSGGSLDTVPGLSWKQADRVVHNPVGPLVPLDDLPDLPYERVHMPAYLASHYLGRRTVAYQSSFGCPFACAFCAVVSMANRRWVAQSPARMESTLTRLVRAYGVDAVQMNDMDFFISEDRAVEFARRITARGLRWWGLGRVDILSSYSDASLQTLARSGLTMVFSGAESGSDRQLQRMEKGGRASTARTLELVARLRAVGIVPELSFVLGAPPDPLDELESTLEFIRQIKRVNPATEIILYTYTPVAGDATVFEDGATAEFFPKTLDDWASPQWEQMSLRRGEGLPWITRRIRSRAQNFERVLNAYYPTVTDVRLRGAARLALRGLAAWRYWLRCYAAPLELRALQRAFRYQRPETTGF